MPSPCISHADVLPGRGLRRDLRLLCRAPVSLVQTCFRVGGCGGTLGCFAEPLCLSCRHASAWASHVAVHRGTKCVPQVPTARRQSARETQDSSAAQGPAAARTKKAIVCKRDTGLVCSPRSRRSADEESNRLQETQGSSAAQGSRRSADGESDVCKRHELGRNCVCVKPFLCYNCYNREKNLKSFLQKLRLWVGSVQSALRLNPGVEPYYISSSFGGKYPQDLRIPCCLAGTEARGKGPVQPVCLMRTVGKPPVLSVRSLHT